LHTGLRLEQHGVKNLTDGPLGGHADIWSLLAQRGIPVANWGSMNARALREAGSLFLPDPWCQSEEPYPPELSAYQQVVTKLVQENSEAGGGRLAASDVARFMLFLARRGLRTSTIASLVAQVFNDSLMHREQKWKRAVLLDRLQFDLFRHYWHASRPAFSTFFLNSTAHYQHAYWHYAFPDECGLTPAEVAEADHAGLRDAILFGYQQMDALLAQFEAFEKHDAMLVLCSALSQQPSGSVVRNFYRPRDIPALLKLVGVSFEELLPVMAEQCSVRFVADSDASRAREKLERLRLDDRPLIDFGPPREACLFFGVGVRTDVAANAVVTGFEGDRSVPFHELFYALPHTKSATHHPDSILWWKTGEHGVHKEPCSILDILPTVSEYFGLDRGAYDPNNALQGASLLSALGLSTGAPAQWRSVA
jgi:hypothetical protein